MTQVQVQAPAASGIIKDHKDILVRVNEAWSSTGWTDAPYLEPLSAEDVAAPNKGKARFRWRYGNIKREDASAFAEVAPAAMEDYFVQIHQILPETDEDKAESREVKDGEGDPPKKTVLLWSGRFVDVSVDMAGSREDCAVQGDQYLIAYDLSHELDRAPIYKGWIDSGGGTPEQLGRMPAFNRKRRHGPRLLGNRSTSKGSTGCYLFSSDDAVWTHRDIAEYLLAHHGPNSIEFTLGGQLEILEEFTSVYKPGRRTVKQALDHLVDRKRGAGWRVAIDEQGKVEVQVFSTFGEDVSVGDRTVPANPNSVEMRLSEDIEVPQMVAVLSSSARYDQLLIEGARIRSTFTVSFDDSTLEALWNSTEETAYLAGTGTPADDSELHDLERKTDKYKRVFQAFRLPLAWDWLAGNGTGGNKHSAAPLVEKDGTVDGESRASSWRDDRPLLRHLVLEEDTQLTTVKAEYKKPLVMVKDVDGLYHQVDQLGKLPDDDEEHAPIGVRMLDADMGLLLNPKINHVLAESHWTGAADSETEPAWDYESLIATVCVETDERLHVEGDIPGSGTEDRVLVISVPDAHYWYVVPGTVTGVTKGVLDRHAGGSVRDDVERLRAIAALARAWYGRIRSAVSVSFDRLEFGYPAGVYVRDVGNTAYHEPVDAVISHRAWDFEARTTTIKTAYAEMDLVRMVDFPGMSDPRAVSRHISDLDNAIDELQEHVGNLPVRTARPGAGGAAAVWARWLDSP